MDAHLYETSFQYRNFDWRNQGNTKSCKVTTIVNTNHFPQNLKKRCRSSLAIAVPQRGGHLHSGDRLFEWPKLSGKKWQMKAPTVKFAIAHLDKNAFCGVQKYFIILLDERVLFVSYLPFSYRVHWGVFTSTVKNLAFKCIADDRPIFSPVYSMK